MQAKQKDITNLSFEERMGKLTLAMHKSNRALTELINNEALEIIEAKLMSFSVNLKNAVIASVCGDAAAYEELKEFIQTDINHFLDNHSKVAKLVNKETNKKKN